MPAARRWVQEDRRGACGKATLASLERAHAHRRQVERDFGQRKQVYYCWRCRGYHVGRPL